MSAICEHLAIGILLVSGATAQSPTGTATLQNITVARDGGNVRVEVTLSAPVTPSIETAINPDRILLDFLDTIANRNEEKEVNLDGLRRVRTAQHNAVPPVTRVVIDLDHAHAYTTKAEGNRIIVTVGPVLSPNTGRSNAPAPPVSLGLSGILRRKAPAQSTTADPPASLPLPDPAPAPTSVSHPHPEDAQDASASTAPQFSGAQAAADSKPRDGSVTTVGFPSASANAVNSTTARAAASSTESGATPGAKAAAVSGDRAAETISADSAAPAPAAGGAAMMLARSDDPNLRTVSE